RRVARPTPPKAGRGGGLFVVLPVVGAPASLALVRHRLMPAGNVHDRQPPVAQSHRSVNPQAFAVRAPVPEDVPHALQARFVYGLPGVEADDPCDAAHSLVTHPRRFAPRAYSVRAPSTSRGAAPS